MIDVDHRHADRESLSQRPLPLRLERLGETAPVGETGQRIGDAELLQAFVCF